MAKFIEVNKYTHTYRRACGEYVVEDVVEPTIINTDQILMIVPQGGNCIITFAGDIENKNNICVAHSAMWVMGLINGHN